MIAPIINKQTKVVYGSRTLNRNNRKPNFIIQSGGKSISLLIFLLYRKKVTDEATGYKVFSKELKPLLINAKANGFDWEAEITARLLKGNYKIVEVPIHYFPRSIKHGKKIKIKDGLKILWTLLRYRLII